MFNMRICQRIHTCVISAEAIKVKTHRDTIRSLSIYFVNNLTPTCSSMEGMPELYRALLSTLFRAGCLWWRPAINFHKRP